MTFFSGRGMWSTWQKNHNTFLFPNAGWIFSKFAVTFFVEDLKCCCFLFFLLNDYYLLFLLLMFLLITLWYDVSIPVELLNGAMGTSRKVISPGVRKTQVSYPHPRSQSQYSIFIFLIIVSLNIFIIFSSIMLSIWPTSCDLSSWCVQSYLAFLMTAFLRYRVLTIITSSHHHIITIIVIITIITIITSSSLS